MNYVITYADFGKKISSDRDSKIIEKEAHEFASELLLPSKEIAPHLVGINLEKLADLKIYWKASMQAILMKANSLGLVTKSQYDYLWRQMSSLGYRKEEPIKIQSDNISPQRDNKYLYEWNGI